MRPFAAALALAACPAAASADERFVERVPYPHVPIVQSQQQAGYPQQVKPHAVPGVNHSKEAGGYVLGRPQPGTGSATGGTFGWDHVGHPKAPKRWSFAPSINLAKSNTWDGYDAEGPKVKDIFAVRPFRRAVHEAQDEHGKVHGK